MDCVLCGALRRLRVTSRASLRDHAHAHNPSVPHFGGRGYAIVTVRGEEFPVRVLNYTLETTYRQSLSMPTGARILTVQTQYEMCQLWALVDETQTSFEARTFVIVGTGNPFPDGIHFTFIGTYQLRSGGLVFHVFEVLK